MDSTPIMLADEIRRLVVSRLQTAIEELEYLLTKEDPDRYLPRSVRTSHTPSWTLAEALRIGQARTTRAFTHHQVCRSIGSVDHPTTARRPTPLRMDPLDRVPWSRQMVNMSEEISSPTCLSLLSFRSNQSIPLHRTVDQSIARRRTTLVPVPCSRRRRNRRVCRHLLSIPSTGILVKWV